MFFARQNAKRRLSCVLARMVGSCGMCTRASPPQLLKSLMSPGQRHAGRVASRHRRRCSTVSPTVICTPCAGARPMATHRSRPARRASASGHHDYSCTLGHLWVHNIPSKRPGRSLFQTLRTHAHATCLPEQHSMHSNHCRRPGMARGQRARGQHARCRRQRARCPSKLLTRWQLAEILHHTSPTS